VGGWAGGRRSWCALAAASSLSSVVAAAAGHSVLPASPSPVAGCCCCRGGCCRHAGGGHASLAGQGRTGERATAGQPRHDQPLNRACREQADGRVAHAASPVA
jgi:hypothetical protein